MVERLEAKQPHYDHMQWVDERLQNLTYLRNISSYPQRFIDLRKDYIKQQVSQDKRKKVQSTANEEKIKAVRETFIPSKDTKKKIVTIKKNGNGAEIEKKAEGVAERPVVDEAPEQPSVNASPEQPASEEPAPEQPAVDYAPEQPASEQFAPKPVSNKLKQKPVAKISATEKKTAAHVPRSEKIVQKTSSTPQKPKISPINKKAVKAT